MPMLDFTAAANKMAELLKKLTSKALVSPKEFISWLTFIIIYCLSGLCLLVIYLEMYNSTREQHAAADAWLRERCKEQVFIHSMKLHGHEEICEAFARKAYCEIFDRRGFCM